MKDLYVMTADADCEALVRALLGNYRKLRIRAVEADVVRFHGRDSGMIREGPEIARMLVDKKHYRKLVLLWDHDGSGRESRDVETVQEELQQRLNGVTWLARSAAIAVDPELEEWILRCPRSLCRVLNKSQDWYEKVTAAFAERCSMSAIECRKQKPKELFEELVYLAKRKSPLPEDYALLATKANIDEWCKSNSFERLVSTLRYWFPPE